MRLRMSLSVFSWVWLFSEDFFLRKDADLMFGNDNISVDAQIQTEGGDKNQPVSQFALGFSIFICLFIQGLLFRKNLKVERKRPSGIPRHWSVESPPQAHTHHLKNRFDFLCLGPFSLFSTISSFYFLQVVKNKSADLKIKQDFSFDLARLLFRRLL